MEEGKKKKGRKKKVKIGRGKNEIGCGRRGVVVRRVVDLPNGLMKQIEMLVDATNIDRVAFYRYGVQLVVDAYAAGCLDLEKVKQYAKSKGARNKRKSALCKILD